MPRLARWIQGLTCPALAIASGFDVGGPWIGVLAFICGVNTVALGLSERRLQKTDGLTTLGLHRR